MNTSFTKQISCLSAFTCRRGIISCSLLLIFLILLPQATWAGEEDINGDDGKTTADEVVLSPPPGSYRLLSDSGFARFPFDLFGGDIRFSGAVNGRPVQLLLDDGFMWDQILFWGSPRVDSLGLSYDGEISIGEVDDENAIASRTASGITVSFPGVEFIDQTAVVTPYSSGVSKMWSGSEGQLSGTFLKHFVVEINFDEMMITLIEPEGFVYRGRGVEIPWRPLGFGPWAIPATLQLADGRTVATDLLMDLGYNDQLQLSTTGEHQITVPRTALPGSLGFNIQREQTRGFYGRVPTVEIGGFAINDVVAGFVSAEDSDDTFHEIMIGLGLLSRFNLIFDYAHQRMFVEPNHTFGDAFEYNMSGMSLRKGIGDYYELVRLVPDSPAGEAGLQVGDRVVQIDGRPAAGFDLSDLRPFLRREGATVTLLLLREGSELEVSIILRRLI